MEEGSESDAVFDAYNLNPQRFINEILNSVDDILDGAFQFSLQKASEITATSDVDPQKSDELARGVSSIRHLTQEVLDKRMEMWEKYCLRHCFSVPEGFKLPIDQDSNDGMALQEDPTDAELDSQLDFLRNKLAAVGKKSKELHQEINSFEKQSTVTQSYNASVLDALQLFEKNSAQKMFQEMGEAAATLHSKIEQVKIKRKEDMERAWVGKMNNANKKQHVTNELNLSPSLDSLQEIAGILRNM